MKRRLFIQQSVAISAGFGLLGVSCQSTTSDAAEQTAGNKVPKQAAQDLLYKISLAEWSFHKNLFNPELFKMSWKDIGEKFKSDYPTIIKGAHMSHLDFPRKAREMGFEGVEYVNTFFYDKAKDTQYLAELKNICENEGITSVLIMCDQEGNLGDPSAAARMQAVENHHKWVDAAKFLGCHSIRVNAKSEGGYQEQQKLAADGLAKLGEYAAKDNINIIVENHGELSSNGGWLAGVMKMAGRQNVGTLPDFGNFCMQREMPTASNPQPACKEEYDRYKGVTELMPYAKGVSAKTYDFNEQGEETQIDYMKMMKIVLDAGYRGFVGVEYEGNRLGEEDGIIATKKLLESVRDKLSSGV